jgi:hypothetical protein
VIYNCGVNDLEYNMNKCNKINGVITITLEEHVRGCSVSIHKVPDKPYFFMELELGL